MPPQARSLTVVTTLVISATATAVPCGSTGASAAVSTTSRAPMPPGNDHQQQSGREGQRISADGKQQVAAPAGHP